MIRKKDVKNQSCSEKKLLKGNIATAVILTKDEKIMLLERAHTGYADGYYSLAGGKCEPGETIIYGAIRETYEEVGVMIREEDLQLIHVLHKIDPTGNHPDWVCLFFHAILWSGEPFNKESNKHATLQWFAYDQLPVPIVPAHQQGIEAWLKKNTYSHLMLDW